MLEEDELRDAILLVFANKQDAKGALNAQQVGILLLPPLLPLADSSPSSPALAAAAALLSRRCRKDSVSPILRTGSGAFKRPLPCEAPVCSKASTGAYLMLPTRIVADNSFRSHLGWLCASEEERPSRVSKAQ